MPPQKINKKQIKQIIEEEFELLLEQYECRDVKVRGKPTIQCRPHEGWIKKDKEDWERSKAEKKAKIAADRKKRGVVKVIHTKPDHVHGDVKDVKGVEPGKKVLYIDPEGQKTTLTVGKKMEVPPGPAERGEKIKMIPPEKPTKKLKESRLEQIIQEELQTALNEGCLPGYEQIGNRRDGSPICGPTTSVPERGAAEVSSHAHPRRRRPIDDESWLARKIIDFFNFEKWYPDPLGFGSTEGEAYRCDPDGTNCYPVESPTPIVPGRMYGETDPDTGVQLPGRVGGGRIQENKFNNIIKEEYDDLLKELYYEEDESEGEEDLGTTVDISRIPPDLRKLILPTVGSSTIEGSEI